MHPIIADPAGAVKEVGVFSPGPDSGDAAGSQPSSRQAPGGVGSWIEEEFPPGSGEVLWRELVEGFWNIVSTADRATSYSGSWKMPRKRIAVMHA
jgi:hypothetical protein